MRRLREHRHRQQEQKGRSEGSPRERACQKARKDMIMLRNVVFQPQARAGSCAGPNQLLLHSIFAWLQRLEPAPRFLARVHFP